MPPSSKTVYELHTRGGVQHFDDAALTPQERERLAYDAGYQLSGDYNQVMLYSRKSKKAKTKTLVCCWIGGTWERYPF